MSASPVELGPFTEGVNVVDPITKLSPRELSICQNLRIGVRGDFYKRPGFDKYGATATNINGSNLTNVAVRYYKSDGSKKLVAAAGGILKFGNDASGAWTPIDINGTGAVMSATNLCDWMVYKDRLYITDGVKPQRYNGTDDIFAGHFIHAAPTLAQAAGGNLTLLGVYKYFVTSVTSDMGEGPKGAEASFTLTGANNRINLSVMVAAPAKHNEVTKRIYRTKAGGTLFYLLTEIPTATTTYQDNTADTALGEEFVPTHIPPADARFVIVGHDERTYWFGRAGANASLVDVSEVGFPDRIRDADFFTVANNDGDIITGGGLVPGGIIFFKRTSLWLSRGFGYGLINIHPREKRGAGVGSVSPFSIVTTPIGLIFLSQRGEIYLFDGTNITEIGRQIASEFKGMTESSLSKVVACYHDYRYIISFDYRGTSGYNKRTWEYDTIGRKWEGPHENGSIYTPSYYSVWDSVLDKGELYWGESNPLNGSKVWGRTEFTLRDIGTKFLSFGRTGANPYGGLSEVKSVKIFVHGEISNDTNLLFSHIDESGEKTSVTLSNSINTTGSILGGPDQLGSVPGKFTLGGSTVAQVLEGSLGPCRSRVPIYEFSDQESATILKLNLFQMKVEALPLK